MAQSASPLVVDSCWMHHQHGHEEETESQPRHALRVDNVRGTVKFTAVDRPGPQCSGGPMRPHDRSAMSMTAPYSLANYTNNRRKALQQQAGRRTDLPSAGVDIQSHSFFGKTEDNGYSNRRSSKGGEGRSMTAGNDGSKGSGVERQSNDRGGKQRSNVLLDPGLEMIPLRGKLLLTYGLCFVCLFLLLCSIIVGDGITSLKTNPMLGPSAEALVKVGALNTPLVRDGEWWRLLWAPFLHAGFFHLVMNCVLWLRLGVMVEPDWGCVRTSVIFMVSAVTGNLLSATLDPYNVSVGASGGIFGVMAAFIVYVIEYWHSIPRPNCVLWIVIISLILGLACGFIPFVDNYAHLGGAAGGLLVGFVTITKWQAWTQKTPPLSNASTPTMTIPPSPKRSTSPTTIFPTATPLSPYSRRMIRARSPTKTHRLHLTAISPRRGCSPTRADIVVTTGSPKSPDVERVVRSNTGLSRDAGSNVDPAFGSLNSAALHQEEGSTSSKTTSSKTHLLVKTPTMGGGAAATQSETVVPNSRDGRRTDKELVGPCEEGRLSPSLSPFRFTLEEEAVLGVEPPQRRLSVSRLARREEDVPMPQFEGRTKTSSSSSVSPDVSSTEASTAAPSPHLPEAPTMRPAGGSTVNGLSMPSPRSRLWHDNRVVTLATSTKRSSKASHCYDQSDSHGGRRRRRQEVRSAASRVSFRAVPSLDGVDDSYLWCDPTVWLVRIVALGLLLGGIWTPLLYFLFICPECYTAPGQIIKLSPG